MRCLRADEAVYWADADTCEHQTKPCHGWVKKGTKVAVKTTSGRERVNIHGALNLETFDAPFIEPLTVNGQSAVQLLAKIEARNPDKRRIHVIWDNAPYHRGPDVRAFLARPDCRIHLIGLPPYWPHLNPIERLWKVMHKSSVRKTILRIVFSWMIAVTYNKYYPTQRQFATAILTFFRQTSSLKRFTGSFFYACHHPAKNHFMVFLTLDYSKKSQKAYVWLAARRNRNRVARLEITGSKDFSCFFPLVERLEKRFKINILCTDDNPTYGRYKFCNRHVVDNAETCLVESKNTILRRQLARLNRKTSRHTKSLDMLMYSVILLFNQDLLQSIFS